MEDEGWKSSEGQGLPRRNTRATQGGSRFAGFAGMIPLSAVGSGGSTKTSLLGIPFATPRVPILRAPLVCYANDLPAAEGSAQFVPDSVHETLLITTGERLVRRHRRHCGLRRWRDSIIVAKECSTSYVMRVSKSAGRPPCIRQLRDEQQSCKCRLLPETNDN